MRLTMFVILLLLFGAAVYVRVVPEPLAHPDELRWWKGNTHTHTLWSDGDGAPQSVVSWYRQRGYSFLVLSDHNVLSQGERWFRIADGGRLDQKRVDALRAEFGEESIEVRTLEDRREMRLWNLPELKSFYEQPEEFLLIQGEAEEAH